VAQRLRLVEILHPDGGAVAEGIDRVVALHRRIAEHRTPEGKVNRVGLRRDRNLNLVRRTPVSYSTVCLRHHRNRTRKLNVWLLNNQLVTRQPHRHAIREQVDLGVGAIKAGHRSNRLRQGGSIGK
jgi:hypothetical protein